MVRARAILSWQIPPIGPNFVPVWGNVVDCWVQIVPTDQAPNQLVAKITERGILAEWDIISAIDAEPKPNPYVPPPPGKLYRGESCTYDITLSAYDKTSFL